MLPSWAHPAKGSMSMMVGLKPFASSCLHNSLGLPYKGREVQRLQRCAVISFFMSPYIMLRLLLQRVPVLAWYLCLHRTAHTSVPCLDTEHQQDLADML